MYVMAHISKIKANMIIAISPFMVHDRDGLAMDNSFSNKGESPQPSTPPIHNPILLRSPLPQPGSPRATEVDSGQRFRGTDSNGHERLPNSAPPTYTED